jgi:2-oxoglutarate ferredoxin oxidoreductase subunit gamma
METTRKSTDMTNRRFEIRIAGFGGQGIVTIGRILGTAFTAFDGLNSVNTQSYGPESRGGACRSEVVVSHGEINYPYVRRADIFVCLSQLAFDTYRYDLKEGGILLIDPGSVKPDDAYALYQVPTMKLAQEIGSIKYQNSVALGALYPLLKEFLKESSLRQALSENVPEKTVSDNLVAFEKGKKYIQTYYHNCFI